MPQNPVYGWGFGGFGIGRFGSAPVENLPLSYYRSLITPEYQLATNFISWLTAALQKVDDVSFCLSQFDTAFDIDTASGLQLNFLGQVIGVSRIVGFQPSNGVSPILDDETYRLLLKARIAQNQWDGRISSLQAIWQQLFPGGKIIIEDAQNMTATIVLSGSFSSITQDLITNGYIVPRPQAVLYNYTFSTLPIFGTDLDNSFIAGVDTGHII
jgi:hypothetical protein